jgi:carboxymethylenebutenolidase
MLEYADEWLEGILPTGKRVEIPVIVVVQFRDGKIASEHIYWDRASVLVQVGLLEANTLPVGWAQRAHARCWTPPPCPLNC